MHHLESKPLQLHHIRKLSDWDKELTKPQPTWSEVKDEQENEYEYKIENKNENEMEEEAGVGGQ